MRNRLVFFLMALCLASCNDRGGNLLRPTRETLKHDVAEKFIGKDGIKRLCESYLGIKYLDRPEIELELLKNRSKSDLINPDIYASDEAQFGAQVSKAYLADVYVKFIDDEFGYGMFAHADIKNGELIGEYTGLIKASDQVQDKAWSWSYPKKIYRESLNLQDISLDAKFSGSAVRFVNHSDTPNTEMRRIFQDGMVRTLYVATKDIASDEQIFVSYGSAYWDKRKKRNT